jgi:hypothetical protein
MVDGKEMVRIMVCRLVTSTESCKTDVESQRKHEIDADDMMLLAVVLRDRILFEN